MQYYDLPLSWILKPHASAYSRENINLFNRFIWYALSQIPDDISWLDEFKTNRITKVLLRGVNADAASSLKELGFKRHLTGEEAVINLLGDLKWRKSVKELYRRGRKLGNFREVPYSRNAAARLHCFKKHCRHGNKPELRYLFNNEFLPETRLFIVEDENEKWLAAVVISKNNVSKYQCELLLKRKGNFPGVMEYLIIEIAKTLRSEGVSEFSLGEVPFVKMDFENKIVNLLFAILQPIILLSYSYKGLYFFKNKFSPEWRPVYLCTNKNIKLVDLFVLSQKTNFLRLILYKIKLQFGSLINITGMGLK